MVLIPSITYNESNVGLTPIQAGIRNRIGIVGTFTKGPANTPTYILGYNDFSTRYGSDTNTGSIAFQAAWDQGARNFMCCRVLGNAVAASGQVTFAGIATVPNTLYFNLQFVGQLQPITDLLTTIVPYGKFTGTVSGRYLFNVSTITSNVATVQWTFVPLGGNQTITWSTITTNFTVNLATAQGVAETVDSGLTLTFGETGQTATIDLRVGDQWMVRVSSYVYEIPINVGDTPTIISTNFINTVVGVFPFGEVTRNSANTGVVFTLSPSGAGIIGNGFSYFFTLLNNTTPGISTVNPVLGQVNTTYMQGGVDGPRNAYLDFYSINSQPLLRILAISEGSWANQLAITLYPLANGQFNLSITDLNQNNFNPTTPNESFLVDFTNTDNAGNIQQLANSNYIKGIFLPQYNNPTSFDSSLIAQAPQRIAPVDSTITDVTDPRNASYYGPSKLINVPLANGYDGPPVTDQDYINAISTLSSQPVHIILTPGIHSSSPDVQNALIANAQAAADADGLRIAVLSARPNLSPSAAIQETIGINSERAVKVAGWSTYAGQSNVARFSLSPDAVYAGMLSAIPFYVGPNAATSAGPIYNILEVDTAANSSSAALQLYTNARLEVLSVNSSTQAYVFTNGLTTSSDASWYKVSIRRTYDQIRMDLNDLLVQYLGEPHTYTLRKQIASAINGYMSKLAYNSQIANYSPVIIDSSNNDATGYIANQLNITLTFLPLYSVDYITVTMIRDTTAGLVSYGQ